MTTPIFENLVFEGGGMKAYAYCGVIDALYKKNILKQFEKIILRYCQKK